LLKNYLKEVWDIVTDSDYFKKAIMRKQVIRGADSISANIAAGNGRPFYKESKQSYFYSRGSIQETKSWLLKCLRRKIIEPSICNSLIGTCNKILLCKMHL